MKSIIAIAAAAAALTLGASAASAQDCENGYMMLRDNIPIACGGGANGVGDINGNADEIPMGTQSAAPGGFFGGPGVASTEEGGANGEGDVRGNADEIPAGQMAAVPPPEEPLYTGSIRSGGGNAHEIPAGGEMRFVESRGDCRPGMWYMQDMQSMNFPVRCR